MTIDISPDIYSEAYIHIKFLNFPVNIYSRALWISSSHYYFQKS